MPGRLTLVLSRIRIDAARRTSELPAFCEGATSARGNRACHGTHRGSKSPANSIYGNWNQPVLQGPVMQERDLGGRDHDTLRWRPVPEQDLPATLIKDERQRISVGEGRPRIVDA